MKTICCFTHRARVRVHTQTFQELNFFPNTYFHTKLQIPAMSSTSRTYTLKFTHMSFGITEDMKP